MTPTREQALFFHGLRCHLYEEPLTFWTVVTLLKLFKLPRVSDYFGLCNFPTISLRMYFGWRLALVLLYEKLPWTNCFWIYFTHLRFWHITCTSFPAHRFYSSVLDSVPGQRNCVGSVLRGRKCYLRDAFLNDKGHFKSLHDHALVHISYCTPALETEHKSITRQEGIPYNKWR